MYIPFLPNRFFLFSRLMQPSTAARPPGGYDPLLPAYIERVNAMLASCPAATNSPPPIFKGICCHFTVSACTVNR